MAEEDAFKRHIAGLYDRVAPTYGRVGPSFFPYAGTRLVELAGVGPGARVLDIGVGRGAVLFAAAERVGPGGQVVGIDLSAGMVRETSAEIAQSGLARATVLQMDAENLAFADGSFEFVLCSFAFFFFPRLERTLGEFARVLRLGGTLGIARASRWTDPRWQWHNGLVARYAHLDSPSQPSGPTPPERIAGLVRQAGFAGVHEVSEEAGFTFRDADEWWDSLWTHGERRALESMAPEELARFREETDARLAEMARQGPLTRRYQFSFTLGAKSP